MSKIITKTYKSPVGEIILGEYREKLVLADWKYRKMRSSIDARIQNALKMPYVSGETDLLTSTMSQFEEYFMGNRTEFSIPLSLIGTDFQKSVWEELLKIPYGKTETYLGLATRLGNPLAIRAVASANGANAISILVPCHRVIGVNNAMMGYAGGVNVKKKLLEAEGCLTKTAQLQIF